MPLSTPMHSRLAALHMRSWPVFVATFCGLLLSCGGHDEEDVAAPASETASTSTPLENGYEGSPTHEWIAGEAFFQWPNDTTHPMYEHIGPPNALNVCHTAAAFSSGFFASGWTGQDPGCPQECPGTSDGKPMCKTEIYDWKNRWVIRGAQDEDVGDVFPQYAPASAAMCPNDKGIGSHPGVDHFWDPTQPSTLNPNGNMPCVGDALHEQKTAPQRAQILWDSMVLPYYGNPAYRHISYYYLGHIAHLLADMSSPAHTHWDVHVLADHYEMFLGAWDNNNDFVFKWYGAHGLTPVNGFYESNSLFGLFDHMARIAVCFESDGWIDGVKWGYGPCSTNPSHTVEHASCLESPDECAKHQDVLEPEAIRHVAGLYKFFWKTVTGGECGACTGCAPQRACLHFEADASAEWCAGSCTSDAECPSGFECSEPIDSGRYCMPKRAYGCEGSKVIATDACLHKLVIGDCGDLGCKDGACGDGSKPGGGTEPGGQGGSAGSVNEQPVGNVGDPCAEDLSCPGALVCLQEEETYCTQTCDDTTGCPEGFVCAAEQSVCYKYREPVEGSKRKTGCAASGGSHSGRAGLWLAVALTAFAGAQRRSRWARKAW